MKRNNALVAFMVIAALATYLVGCDITKPPTEVRIGLIVPLTGGAAEFGKWARNGAELTVAELNQQNKSSGKRFTIIYEDHQMDVKLGLSAFKKLIAADKVVGVVTSGSGVVLAIAPEAERTHTVQLNHAAVSPAIRKAGEYTFTLVNDADIETDEIARLAYQRLGIKRLAVLYANTAYGVTTKDAIVKSFSQIGGTVVGTVAFQEDFTDARAQLTALKEMTPQAVYLVATIKDSGRVLRQAQELGFRPQWLTYNAFESPQVLKIAGEAAEGVIYTSSNLFDLPGSEGKPEDFLRSYTSKYGESPNLYAATAYDAVHLLARTYASSDGSREGIRRALASVREYHGASGVITFDSDGSVRKPVFLKIVRNGQFAIYEHKD